MDYYCVLREEVEVDHSFSLNVLLGHSHKLHAFNAKVRVKPDYDHAGIQYLLAVDDLRVKVKWVPFKHGETVVLRMCVMIKNVVLKGEFVTSVGLVNDEL